MSKYVVINPDGTYAGVLCQSWEEARELAGQKEGRVIGEVQPIVSNLTKHIHCPVNSWNCPYYSDGICTLDDPMSDCDDFAGAWGEDTTPDEYVCNGGESCVAYGGGE